MIEWIFTGIFIITLASIVRTEIRHGRRTKDFLGEIGPEIDALNKRATARYRAKFGRDPSMAVRTNDLPKGA